MPIKASKRRRYAGTPEFYNKKLVKVMQELGMKKEHYDLKYDPWEGARLDFTYKGVTRRLERLLDNDLHFGSDALAQITLTMEKFLWMKRERIFDLEVAAAGLPQLQAPLPEYFRELEFTEIPSSAAEVTTQFRKLSQTTHPDKFQDPVEKEIANKKFDRLIKARDAAWTYFEGK